MMMMMIKTCIAWQERFTRHTENSTFSLGHVKRLSASALLIMALWKLYHHHHHHHPMARRTNCTKRPTDELHDFPRRRGRQNAVTLKSVRAAARRHHDHPQSEIRQQRKYRVLKRTKYDDFIADQQTPFKDFRANPRLIRKSSEKFCQPQ